MTDETRAPQTQYLDKDALFVVFPASPSTVWRLSHREIDPFPKGRLIAGKRYRGREETLEWLARQDDPPPFNPSLTKAEPPDTSHDTDPAQQDLAGIGHNGAPEATVALAEDATAPPVALTEATA